MTIETPRYPSPVEDMDNRPLLEAWKEGALWLQSCRGCGESIFYPRPMCPHCWSDDLEWHRSAGVGHVISYSKVYRPNHEAFTADVPVVLAEVRVSEGATLLARIIGDHHQVRSGAPIELVEDGWVTRSLPLPAFRVSPPRSAAGT
jgi:uncharacterized OB-fold protein